MCLKTWVKKQRSNHKPDYLIPPWPWYPESAYYGRNKVLELAKCIDSSREEMVCHHRSWNLSQVECLSDLTTSHIQESAVINNIPGQGAVKWVGNGATAFKVKLHDRIGDHRVSEWSLLNAAKEKLLSFIPKENDQVDAIHSMCDGTHGQLLFFKKHPRRESLAYRL